MGKLVKKFYQQNLHLLILNVSNVFSDLFLLPNTQDLIIPYSWVVILDLILTMSASSFKVECSSDSYLSTKLIRDGGAVLIRLLQYLYLWMDPVHLPPQFFFSLLALLYAVAPHLITQSSQRRVCLLQLNVRHFWKSSSVSWVGEMHFIWRQNTPVKSLIPREGFQFF